MQPTPGTPVTRRAVLLGAAGLAGTALLAACGSSGSKTASSDTNVALTPDDGGSSLIPIFGADAQYAYVVSGTPQRLAFAVNGPEGRPLLDVPASLDFQLSKDGQPVGAATKVLGHTDGVPIGFYPYRATFDAPGTYQVAVTLDGKPSTVSFDVVDPAKSPLLQRGGAMRPVETPTVTDARGVDPICTQPSGTCPFHTVTVTEALATGKPTALLVSTPKFCQIGVCGPVLDLLVEVAPQYAGVQIVHAEVYTDAEAILDASNSTGSGSGTPAAPADATASATLAPVVETYGLSYEPALFLADGVRQARRPPRQRVRPRRDQRRAPGHRLTAEATGKRTMPPEGGIVVTGSAPVS